MLSVGREKVVRLRARPNTHKLKQQTTMGNSSSILGGKSAAFESGTYVRVKKDMTGLDLSEKRGLVSWNSDKEKTCGQIGLVTCGDDEGDTLVLVLDDSNKSGVDHWYYRQEWLESVSDETVSEQLTEEQIALLDAAVANAFDTRIKAYSQKYVEKLCPSSFGPEGTLVRVTDVDPRADEARFAESPIVFDDKMVHALGQFGVVVSGLKTNNGGATLVAMPFPVGNVMVFDDANLLVASGYSPLTENEKSRLDVMKDWVVQAVTETPKPQPCATENDDERPSSLIELLERVNGRVERLRENIVQDGSGDDNDADSDDESRVEQSNMSTANLLVEKLCASHQRELELTRRLAVAEMKANSRV